MASSRTDIAFGDNYGGFSLGQNFGQVHVTPQRPETPPKPSSNVPFPRDPHFVKRATLTDQIRAHLEPASRVALVGLGGVGKSQLAIEYARELWQQSSSQTWVLWIHASSAARFEQDVRDVADLLKINGRKDPKAGILKLLRDRLRDESKGRWLVVLDNADDADFLLELPAGSEQSAKRRIDYIPICEHGSVLITTRNRSEALKLVYDSTIVDVAPMSTDEAEALLVSKLGHSSPEDRLLVEALDCIPLAITQAAAYIKERGSRCSVQQYYKEMEQSRESRTSLLRRHIPLPNRDLEANNAVMLTWQISFEHIHQKERSAAELLSFMSFCDRLAIPESLIRIDGDDIESPAQSSTFEDDIIVLRNFSLVSETADMRVWVMHRLVQDATQVWLEERGRFHEVFSRFVHRLSLLFPESNFENWSSCRILYPHAINIAEHRPASKATQLKWASLMNNAAWYAEDQGDYNAMLTLATLSLTATSEWLGNEHEITMHNQAVVAGAYRNQGRSKEAEQLQVKVTETWREKLGAEHPDTLSSMAHLGSIYQHQGRWEEAEQLQVEVIETCREKLGAKHPHTLSNMNNLALTYRSQGTWEEAEQLLIEVIETCREKLGTKHPDTLSSMNNLASTYQYQGRSVEAEQLLVEVIETGREKLGAKHPNTLTSMKNLALIYQGQGRWNESEILLCQTVDGSKTSLGLQHPDTLSAISALANIHHMQKQKVLEDIAEERTVRKRSPDST